MMRQAQRVIGMLVFVIDLHQVVLPPVKVLLAKLLDLLRQQALELQQLLLIKQINQVLLLQHLNQKPQVLQPATLRAILKLMKVTILVVTQDQSQAQQVRELGLV
jgi:hypothetical protein